MRSRKKLEIKYVVFEKLVMLQLSFAKISS